MSFTVSRKVAFSLSFIMIMLAAASGGSLCQEAPFNPELDRHLKLGPFRLRPFFALKDTGYDSNIYRRRTDVVSGFTSTLSPGCDIFLNIGHRGSLLMREQADFVVFANQSSQNHVNNRMLARMDLFFNRFSILGRTSLLNLKERPNNEIDARVRNRTNSYLLSPIYKYSSRTDAALTFSRIAVRYDRNDEYFGASLSDEFDRDEDSIILTFSQKVLRKTAVALESEVANYDFLKESGRNTRAEYYKIGFTFDPAAIISGKLKIGHASFRPDDELYSNYNGPIGEASISYRITESTRMTILAKKEIVFSVYGQNLFFIQDSYGLSIFQYLTRRLGVEMSGTYYKSRYTVPETIALSDGGSIFDFRHDTVKTGFLGLQYKLNDQYKVGIRATRWRRESNLYNQNVDETMLGVTFGYQY